MAYKEKRPFAVGLIAACWSLMAQAGGMATLEVRSEGDVQQITYEFAGDQVRMGLPGGGAEGYMVITGGVPYVVMTGEQTMVLDLRQSMQMIGGMVSIPETPGQPDDFHSLEATGRKETVAGIPGEVYRMTYTEEGQRRTEEVVLSGDARARAFSKALMAMSVMMADAAGGKAGDTQAAFDQALGGKGMLRMGDQFRLASYRDQTPGSDRFRLPAPPTDLSAMQGMQGLFGQGGGSGQVEAGGKASGGVDFGGLFGGKAERQQQRVEDRAEQEVDQATDTAVDKALDKAFKKLFGN